MPRQPLPHRLACLSPTDRLPLARALTHIWPRRSRPFLTARERRLQERLALLHTARAQRTIKKSRYDATIFIESASRWPDESECDSGGVLRTDTDCVELLIL